MKQVKAFLIDPNKKKIKEIIVEDNIHDIKDFLEYDEIDIKIIKWRIDLIYDKNTMNNIGWKTPLFRFKTEPFPYVGKAILIEKNTMRNYCDHKISIDEVKDMITFFNLFDYNYDAQVKMRKLRKIKTPQQV